MPLPTAALKVIYLPTESLKAIQKPAGALQEGDISNHPESSVLRHSIFNVPILVDETSAPLAFNVL